MALAPAPDCLQQHQARLKTLYHRHPAATPAVLRAAPTARHRPLGEQIPVQHRGIKPAVPDKAQFCGVGQGRVTASSGSTMMCRRPSWII